MSAICEDCRENLASKSIIYGCPCNPDVYFCLNCSINGKCFKCFRALKMVNTSSCYLCVKRILPGHEFKDGAYTEYCVQCMREGYLRDKAKPKIEMRQGYGGIDKLKVYSFLKCFCYKCSRKMHEQESYSRADHGIIEILPLDKNICEFCLAKSKSPPNGQSAPAKALPQQPGACPKAMQHDKIPKSSGMKCTACGISSGNFIVTDDYVLCSFCARFSELEESFLENRQMKGSSQQSRLQNNEEVGPRRSPSPNGSGSAHQPISPTYSRVRLSGLLKPSEGINQEKKELSEKQIKNQELLVKEGIKDNEFVKCCQCGLVMEGINSVWNEFVEGEYPLCRGCFVIISQTCVPTIDYLKKRNEEKIRDHKNSVGNRQEQLTRKNSSKIELPNQNGSQKIRGKGEVPNQKKNDQKEPNRLQRRESAAENFPQIEEEKNYQEPSRSIYNSRIIEEDEKEDLLPQFSQQKKGRPGNANYKNDEKANPDSNQQKANGIEEKNVKSASKEQQKFHESSLKNQTKK